MNDVVLGKIVQRYKYLNSKPLNKVKTKALEVVHLYEFIQVHRQHLESYDQMLSEEELVQPSDNVFLILRIFIIQVLNQLCFNKTLLIQPLFVLKDLDCYVFLLLVIITFQYNAKTAFTALFYDLISKAQMLIHPYDILVLIIIKAVVGRLIKYAHLRLSSM